MPRDAVAAGWQAAVRLGFAAAACGLLAGCGGHSEPGTPTAATTPAPGPPPSPVPVSFLHLRHEGGDITTYRIDGTTGRLQLAGTQRLGDVRALAGDPAGRYLATAYEPRDLSVDPRQDASIALYESDESGSLVALSEVWGRPWEAGYGHSCGNRGWTWLALSSDRVWAVWESRYGGACQHQAFTAVTHEVAAEGRLATEPSVGSWMDSGGAVVDPGSDVLYKSRDAFHDGGPAPLTAHAVGSDGRLVITGYSNLCVASEVADYDPIQPLVALRGYVFGNAPCFGVCSWEGARLAPRANLGTPASLGAAFSPAAPTEAALLALAGDVFGRSDVYLRTDLRLLAMESDGGTARLDTIELPGRVRQLLFHPSGRFLYVADEEGTVRTYSVTPERRLEPIGSLPDAAHASSPSDATPPPFMAVSALAGVPPP